MHRAHFCTFSLFKSDRLLNKKAPSLNLKAVTSEQKDLTL